VQGEYCRSIVFLYCNMADSRQMLSLLNIFPNTFILATGITERLPTEFQGAGYFICNDEMICSHILQSMRHLLLLATSTSILNYTIIILFALLSCTRFTNSFDIATSFSPITKFSITNNRVPTFHTLPQSIKTHSTSNSILQSTTLPDDIMSSSSAVDVPNISKATLETLVEYASSFSAANGLQVEVSTSTSSNKKSYTTAPISLLPNTYPTKQFHHAKSLAVPFNKLVDNISRDGNFLKETLKDVRDVDLYTGNLLDLYEEIYLGELCVLCVSRVCLCTFKLCAHLMSQILTSRFVAIISYINR